MFNVIVAVPSFGMRGPKTARFLVEGDKTPVDVLRWLLDNFPYDKDKELKHLAEECLRTKGIIYTAVLSRTFEWLRNNRESNNIVHYCFVDWRRQPPPSNSL